jgi:tryptophanyl-tRNA synthetase
MSGMRPTGKLHLGHYMGVLRNWVELQNRYRCYFMVADWHALTTKYHDTAAVQDNIFQMAVDWLAAGIDPTKAAIYVQSEIKEIAELALLLGMLTPKKWAETDPTLKDMVMADDELNYGLLGYPILQTADILAPQGEFVPVGKDQLAHLEISRDIVRRFNHLYRTELFAEPQPLLAEVPMLSGLDGRKMSKSYDNAIALADSAEETERRIKTAITDPARVRRQDPGEPENCQVVFPYYKVFAPQAEIDLAAQECRTAARGCMDCKKRLAAILNEQMQPIRERRTELEADRHQVMQILDEGAEAARAAAVETLSEVRSLMGVSRTPAPISV